MKDGAWVTLDNGAGDHDIVSQGDLLHTAVDLHPSEVIPPDILFDGRATIRNFESFYREMHVMGSLLTSPPIQIFACPQGRNQAEWLFCYEYFLEHPAVATIGFSKIAIPKAFMGATGDRHIKEARNYVWSMLKAAGLIKKPIHFLGMGDPTEMLHYKGEEFARSTDSCNSIWSAMNLQEWQKGQFDRVPTPKDYFGRHLNQVQRDLALDNIKYFKGLVK